MLNLIEKTTNFLGTQKFSINLADGTIIVRVKNGGSKCCCIDIRGMYNELKGEEKPKQEFFPVLLKQKIDNLIDENIDDEEEKEIAKSISYAVIGGTFIF